MALIAALTIGSFGALETAQAQTRYVPSYTGQVQYAQAKTSAKISYAKAKSIALNRHPGSKYVGMQLNGNTYVVRVEVSNGRVIDVRVDAATGRVR